MSRTANTRYGLWLTVLVFCALLASAPKAQADGVPAPHLRVTVAASPSRIIPGDQGKTALYSIGVVNDGSAPTDCSPISIADELPAGVVFEPHPFFPGSFGLSFSPRFGPFNLSSTEETCTGEGTPVFTCVVEGGALLPGYGVNMQVPFVVEPGIVGPAVNTVRVSGGGVPEAKVTLSSPVSSEQAGFELANYEASTSGVAGEGFTQAGGHPYRFGIGFDLAFARTTEGGPANRPSANLKEASVTLPKGLVVDPEATPKCTEERFETPGAGANPTSCPAASAVGIGYPSIGKFGFPTGVPGFAFTGPIYNLVPPPGVPAALGFDVAGLGVYLHIFGHLDSAGDFVLSARSKDITILEAPSGISVELWGDPAGASHVYRRGECAVGFALYEERCEIEDEGEGKPFLTMPTDCGAGPLSTSLLASAWQAGIDPIAGTVDFENEPGDPIEVDGCDRLRFEPTISSQPTTNLSDSPSGLEFDLHQPQDESLERLATAALRDARVTLPEGMTVNPSAANGLGACEESQIGYRPAEGRIHFSEVPQTCPAAAKLGSAEVISPLLEDELPGGGKVPHVLPGAVYLAKPYENPFGSLLALYLAIEDEGKGIVAKLAGKVEPDPQTGQLTATFAENPELPIEDVRLHFFGGPTGALQTPLACGTHTTTSDLTPWSTPAGADAHPSDSFATSLAASGSGPCPGSEAQAPNQPSFSAGTLAPQAGSYSPFLLLLARPDGTQRITRIDTTLPEGLVGKLAGIPYCPEAAIALAKSREAPEKGSLEQSSPACPQSSEVGTVTVGAGAGSSPLFVSGHAYLAGPYEGAPLSLLIITPALAGPFDLGDVVTRVALEVDPFSARIHAVSDPLPTIIDGIPLDLRSIALRLDRPGFTLNPTSCEPMAIAGQAATASGQAAALSDRFQVGGCNGLKFKPKLKISLRGATRRSGHPALKAVLTYPKGAGYANIARAQVGLPHSEFLDQGNIKTVCTQGDLKAGTCPPKSIYGHAKAWTPLLDKPLEGPVYLGVGFGHKLPDLVADLNGQVRILVHGKVDTDRQEGLRNTFESVPDAPVSRFVLEMKGGPKKGLLENSENICREAQRAEVRFSAQNGDVRSFKQSIANDCGRKRGKKGGGKR